MPPELPAARRGRQANTLQGTVRSSPQSKRNTVEEEAPPAEEAQQAKAAPAGKGGKRGSGQGGKGGAAPAVHFDALERQINDALVRLSLSEEQVAASLRQAQGAAAAPGPAPQQAQPLANVPGEEDEVQWRGCAHHFQAALLRHRPLWAPPALSCCPAPSHRAAPPPLAAPSTSPRTATRSCLQWPSRWTPTVTGWTSTPCWARPPQTPCCPCQVGALLLGLAATTRAATLAAAMNWPCMEALAVAGTRPAVLQQMTSDPCYRLQSWPRPRPPAWVVSILWTMPRGPGWPGELGWR